MLDDSWYNSSLNQSGVCRNSVMTSVHNLKLSPEAVHKQKWTKFCTRQTIISSRSQPNLWFCLVRDFVYLCLRTASTPKGPKKSSQASICWAVWSAQNSRSCMFHIEHDVTWRIAGSFLGWTESSLSSINSNLELSNWWGISVRLVCTRSDVWDEIPLKERRPACSCNAYPNEHFQYHPLGYNIPFTFRCHIRHLVTIPRTYIISTTYHACPCFSFLMHVIDTSHTISQPMISQIWPSFSAPPSQHLSRSFQHCLSLQTDIDLKSVFLEDFSLIQSLCNPEHSHMLYDSKCSFHSFSFSPVWPLRYNWLSPIWITSKV